MPNTPRHDEVVLELPALGLSASVVRALAAAVAMAHDLPLDEITDIRLAVDEACTVLLPLAAADTTMRCTVEVRRTDLRVTAEVTSVADHLDVTDSIDLQILSSLTTEIHTEARTAPDGEFRLVIELLLARTTI